MALGEMHGIGDVSDVIALEALNRAPFAMIITNPDYEDNPIVYVNSAFERVTGYSSAAAVGRNCRFLQGEDTDPKTIAKLREAIAENANASVDILNYRADGTAFWNRLMISPLATAAEGRPYFLGVQMALDFDPEEQEKARIKAIDTALSEIQHRVKNHLSMIVGMIRIQARKSDAKGDFTTLARRVETLQLLYEELNSRGGAQNVTNEAPIALGAYLTRVANAISHLDGRRGVRVNTDADAITVPFEVATRLGLVLSEILTNALQHAFEGREAGLVEVRIKALSAGVIRIQISDDGIGMPDGANWPEEGNLGSHIVRELVVGLEGKLSVERGVTGTIISLDVPANVANPA